MKQLIALALALLLPSCGGKTKHTQTRQTCVIDSVSVEPPMHNFAVKPTFVLHTTCNTVYRTTRGDRFKIGDTMVYIYINK
jgi:hypothetical protein